MMAQKEMYTFLQDSCWDLTGELSVCMLSCNKEGFLKGSSTGNYQTKHCKELCSLILQMIHLTLFGAMVS